MLPSDERAVSIQMTNEPYLTTLNSQSTSRGPWPISFFTSKYKNEKFDKNENSSKKIRKFYRRQDELIEAFEDLYNTIDADNHLAASLLTKAVDKSQRKAIIYSKITLLLNFILLIVKIVASVRSGSMTVIGSLIDSSVDLASGIVMWSVLRLIRKRDPFQYPQG
ncbi:hypothetical protein ACOME3_003885 [Neoechinorhynchus agilis]